MINVSGHRLGTMEIESALVSHPAVAEAAVAGRPDTLKGSAVAGFVTLEAGRQGDAALIQALREHVAHEIGPTAKPDAIKSCAASCGTWPAGKPSKATPAPWRTPWCWSVAGGYIGIDQPHSSLVLEMGPLLAMLPLGSARV